MGTPVPPPPPDFGTDCPTCTPGLWAVGETPRVIYAYCSGFGPCPPVNSITANGICFVLPQVVGSPCKFETRGANWILELDVSYLGGTKSFCQLSYRGNVHLRVANGPVCPPELYEYVNPVLSCFPGNLVVGGTITIFWNLAFFPAVTGFGLDAVHALKHEIRKHADGDNVEKWCDLYYRANLKVKVTP